MKTKLIMSIMTRAMKIVPIEIARQIQDIIESELKDVDVTASCTALVAYTGAPSSLRYFIASKRLQGLSDGTLVAYERTLGKFLATIQKNVEDISELDCKAYLAAYRQSGAKITTADTMRSILRSFFSWCELSNLVRISPMRAITRFKMPQRKPKALTRTELEKIRLACRDARDRAIVEAYYSTACRVSELVAVTREQIDFGTGRIVVIGKGNKERTVSLTETAAMYVQQYLATRTDLNPALFTTDKDPHRTLGIRAIQDVFKRLGIAAGLTKRVHPHLMRHTRATNMLKSNVSIDKIRLALGHVNMATTLIYANTMDDAVQSAMRDTAA